MNIKLDYLDHAIVLEEARVTVIEVYNKRYLYKLINDFILIADGEVVDNVFCFDISNKEISLTNKIKVFVDYFHLEFDSKKTLLDITKYVLNEMDDQAKNQVIEAHQKVVKVVNKILMQTELPLYTSSDMTVESIMKSVKVGVKRKNEVLDNILLIMDIERVLRAYHILIFVNLKQLLNVEELIELYKYSVYSGIKLVLIDCQKHELVKEYEKKLVIDDDLDEFVI